MTDELQALLPCPFCGGDASMEPWHGGAPTKMMVACPSEETGCEVGPMVTGETPAEAIAAWNRRTERPALIAEVERLREALEWALREIDGENIYRQGHQQINARNRASAALGAGHDAK